MVSFLAATSVIASVTSGMHTSSCDLIMNDLKSNATEVKPGFETPDHFGNAVLCELAKRGKRYTNLTYVEHRELKAAKTFEEFERFLNTNMPGIDTSNQSVSQIVSLMEEFWETRAEIKRGIWHLLLWSDTGIVCLIVFLPVLLIGHCLRRFLTSEKTH